MRPNKLLTLLFILITNTAFGHKDLFIIKDFGNVKVRIITGFEYEEIRKGWIIGEMASKLCQQLNYTKPIFIDFNHHYVSDCKADHFISFDDGSIIQKWETEKPQAVLKENALVIREVSRQFSPSVTLKLLEYAISNVYKIRSAQKTIAYNQNYCQWKIKTIDTLLIKKIVRKSVSEAVNKVLSAKVYRQEEGKSCISYYFQDNKYHVFYNERIVNYPVLLIVDNIYQFLDKNNVVFDTDSSFYYIGNSRTSKRQVIKGTYDNYNPFKISSAGANKIRFSFWYYDRTEGVQPKEKRLVYHPDRDELTED
jgi:hypothetical protein